MDRFKILYRIGDEISYKSRSITHEDPLYIEYNEKWLKHKLEFSQGENEFTVDYESKKDEDDATRSFKKV